MVKIDPVWITAAQSAMKKTRLYASVSIGQFGIESAWGKKMPGFNPFGIKHMAGYPDQMFHTHELIHGNLVPEDLVFAKFASLDEAFEAHATLIMTRPQYAPARAAMPNLDEFVARLGPVYATGKNYAETLMTIINGDGLRKYDA